MMSPEEREEFKKQLLANLEDTKRQVAETRLLAEQFEREADEYKKQQESQRPFANGSHTPLPPPGFRSWTIEEMREYLEKARMEYEEARRYRNIPWWKKIIGIA